MILMYIVVFGLWGLVVLSLFFVESWDDELNLLLTEDFDVCTHCASLRLKLDRAGENQWIVTCKACHTFAIANSKDHVRDSWNAGRVMHKPPRKHGKTPVHP